VDLYGALLHVSAHDKLQTAKQIHTNPDYNTHPIFRGASQSNHGHDDRCNQYLRHGYVWLSPEQKELIAAHAERTGESINAFVQRAIAETIERDNHK
jgi:hypothetical protein